MIKRISFATRRQDLTVTAFAAAWPSAVAGEAARAANAPSGVRPLRVAVCTILPELTGPHPRHDGIVLEWFTDAAHLRRYRGWLGGGSGTGDGSGTEAPKTPKTPKTLPIPKTPPIPKAPQAPDAPPAAALLDPGASPVIVAEEAVLRGAGWLDRRWRDGGDRLKHMALAVRAAGLTPAEFSRAWRSRAGQVRRAGATQVTAIPDEVRGRAYVQNHPDLAGERAYDAVNEVWFDDLAGLRARVEWFRANLSGPAEPGPAEADLIRQSWFIAVREHVVLA